MPWDPRRPGRIPATGENQDIPASAKSGIDSHTKVLPAHNNTVALPRRFRSQLRQRPRRRTQRLRPRHTHARRNTMQMNLRVLTLIRWQRQVHGIRVRTGSKHSKRRNPTRRWISLLGVRGRDLHTTHRRTWTGCFTHSCSRFDSQDLVSRFFQAVARTQSLAVGVCPRFIVYADVEGGRGDKNSPKNVASHDKTRHPPSGTTAYPGNDPLPVPLDTARRASRTYDPPALKENATR